MMKWFLIKIKSWQLFGIILAAMLMPVTIGYMLLVKSDIASDDLGAMFIIMFFRTAGISVILISTVLFFWIWSVSNYLYRVLPDKSVIKFNKYKWFMALGYLIGLIWGLIIFSGFLLVIIIVYYYLFFGFIILLVILSALFSKYNSFPYRAAKSLILEVPYNSVKGEPVIFRFNWISDLQRDVRKVYMKYGKK